MGSKPKNANQDPGAQSSPQSIIYSQPWWRGVGYNVVPSAALGENTAKSPSMEHSNGAAGTIGTQSLAKANGSLEKSADVCKETQATTTPQSGSDGNCGQENDHLQHVVSTVAECLIPPTQMELVGHSIACTPYPYSDPYYGGIMAAYGTQALAHSPFLGMHHTRMPLPLEMAEEPVYVNAKQYHGILRRRQSRAKAELEKKVIRARKPYLHESRHQHAMRRERGCGGRFLTKKLDSNAAKPTLEKSTGSGASPCTQTASLSGSEPFPSNHTANLDSNNQKEGLHTFSNGNGCYQHHQGFSLSKFHPHSEERGEEGDCSGQLRGSITVNQAPNRAVAIQ